MRLVPIHGLSGTQHWTTLLISSGTIPTKSLEMPNLTKSFSTPICHDKLKTSNSRYFRSSHHSAVLHFEHSPRELKVLEWICCVRLCGGGKWLWISFWNLLSFVQVFPSFTIKALFKTKKENDYRIFTKSWTTFLHWYSIFGSEKYTKVTDSPRNHYVTASPTPNRALFGS